MLSDRHRLTQRWQRLKKEQNQDKLAALAQQVIASVERAEKRRQNIPRPTFEADLPVIERREEVKRAIADNQVIILCGETGSGKTTQLPKICLELGRGVTGMIGHTQPRRIAARTVATRIAEELQSEIGQTVGYKVRFHDHVNADRSYVKLMTDGILLAETQNDKFLNQYDTLIIDEAHERSLNIDFLLGYIKQLLPKRPDLKVIITSATIDTERFSKHFDNAPVIEVSG
ncbi:MAG: DEAD/DEAH box helicase, partial [Pseudomonadota bacterium]|nr:DEAD/DEAH box helicase [Pseudomonadota bacterium]